MFTTIVILSIVSVLLLLFTTALLIHVVSIQKELKSIAEEQSRQNADLAKLFVHGQHVATAINNISGYIEELNKKQMESVFRKYGRIVGEA